MNRSFTALAGVASIAKQTAGGRGGPEPRTAGTREVFMKRDLLLVFGLLLSTASQLRPLGAPIGPGELCLVIWIALRTRPSGLRAPSA